MTRHQSWAQSAPTSKDADAMRADADWTALLEACQHRFTGAEYVVECDSKHTVWVKNTSTGRSVGLHPWMLRNHSLDDLLAGVERRVATSLASE